MLFIAKILTLQDKLQLYMFCGLCVFSYKCRTGRQLADGVHGARG